MLWYKSWLETRWRFLIGAVVVICSAASVVFVYPRVLELMPLVPSVSIGGELGRQIREAAELAREYRGYIWSQWFRQNLPQLATFFAVLLGTGGLLRGSALFTLSLPVSRSRLVAVRAAVGLSQLFVLILAPSLLIPLVSPAVGESYSIGSALVYSACTFIASAVFFSLAFLLSTTVNDIWRPMLIALSIALGLAIGEHVVRGLSQVSIFRVMSAETYFRSGHLPWFGLVMSAAASAAMLYGAALSTARRDF